MLVNSHSLRLTLTSIEGRVEGEWHVREGTTTLNLPSVQPSTLNLHLHDSARWISGAKLVVE